MGALALLTCLVIWQFLRLDSRIDTILFALSGMLLFPTHPIGLAVVPALGILTRAASVPETLSENREHIHFIGSPAAITRFRSTRICRTALAASGRLDAAANVFQEAADAAPHDARAQPNVASGLFDTEPGRSHHHYIGVHMKWSDERNVLKFCGESILLTGTKRDGS